MKETHYQAKRRPACRIRAHSETVCVTSKRLYAENETVARSVVSDRPKKEVSTGVQVFVDTSSGAIA